ncbi:MAG: L-aspartate oxidase [Eubacteriaceae bacterium]|nr:L-aspartate oxidase [Eubacteriaceae bacterium]
MDEYYDVIVVGSGIAGLNCCLNLSPDLNILLIAKDSLSTTNTSLAQGGIATAVSEEDIAPFIEDTMKAGKFHNDPDAVRVLAENSFESILSIIDIGIEFDQDNSHLDFTREGGHSRNRIVHVKDKTGEYVSKAMISAILKEKHIDVIDYSTLLDIQAESGRCTGIVLNVANEIRYINSKVTVLATGGVGGLFKSSTNQPILRGDGMGIALRHGIALKDMDCIQFHPTVLYDGKTGNRKLLITEALRGEGARLYNSEGDRFINELSPRDIVCAAIKNETFDLPYVFLDISFKESKFIMERFPLIYSSCLKLGIDITREPIPVYPAQHYMMGGIKVDTYSRTSMENLFAVGETSCTGIHGKNRLASNSLLEGLVFSKRASDVINSTVESIRLSTNTPVKHSMDYYLENDPGQLVKKEIMKRTDRYDDELL